LQIAALEIRHRQITLIGRAIILVAEGDARVHGFPVSIAILLNSITLQLATNANPVSTAPT